MVKDLSDPDYVSGQQLRRHKNELASEIPDIKIKIERYQEAQSKLNIAIDHIQCAMRSLPGAKIIMDKQAITKDLNKLSIILGKQTLKPDAIEDANKLIALANDMVKEAARLCPRDAYVIDFNLDSTSEQDMVKVLTQCRDHRIKVENMLRTMINPRLHIYKGQMTTAKVHYEQRVMACVDHEVVTLDAVLRMNGCLRDESLDEEISRLRMGTRAAMAAVVSESSERVTVDDVLEISMAEGRLPEYASVEPHHNSDSSNSSHTDDEPHEFLNVNNQVPTNISCELPSYHMMEQPPSYYASTQ
ncbi:hypothetical protein G6F56_011328 [Rhizopus delemar]|nr:hypothetical protein G6F56_011328 [Rhizopus delemar]